MNTESKPTIIEDRLRDLRLLKSSHSCPDEGLCAMEAAAYIVGGPHTDHPETACPVLGYAVRSWNDNVDDETRQKLIPLLPRLAVSRSTPEVEFKRGLVLADCAVRRILPNVLELAEQAEVKAWAGRLRELPQISDETTIRRSREVVSSFSDFLASYQPPSTSPAPSHLSSWSLALDLALDLARDLARALARALPPEKLNELIYIPSLEAIEAALAITE